MSEPFEFVVAYGTTFEQIEELRCECDSFLSQLYDIHASYAARMLTFVKTERRDYFPVFDVFVLGGSCFG